MCCVGLTYDNLMYYSIVNIPIIFMFLDKFLGKYGQFYTLIFTPKNSIGPKVYAGM